jgi:glycine cleavage system H lipoate-binding protein
MGCPFLREETVRLCERAPAARPLPREAIDAAGDRCSRWDHVSCPYAADRGSEKPASTACPSLILRQVQFCAAVSARTFIPSAAVLPSRCSTDLYRHCESYLERRGPRAAAPAPAVTRGAGGGVATVDGIAVPLDLDYTPNHLWREVGADGTCVIGVDGFLARVIGKADSVTFVPTRPGAQSFAVLTVAGVELPLAFPRVLERVVINYSLHGDPDRLACDPYGSGWLFEGYRSDGLGAGDHPEDRLVRGRDAAAWMRREVERLSAKVHDAIGRPGTRGERVAADGGTFASGLARTLRREEALHLFSEFFPMPSSS